jgi:hypothetical protein
MPLQPLTLILSSTPALGRLARARRRARSGSLSPFIGTDAHM